MGKELEFLRQIDPQYLSEEERIQGIYEYLFGLLQAGAIKVRGLDEEAFVLRSGKHSRIYADNREQTGLPGMNLSLLSVLIHNEAKRSFGVDKYNIAAVDSAMGPMMAGALISYAHMHGVICRDELLLQAERGSEKLIYAPDEPDRDLPIVLPDDVVTSGGTIFAKSRAIKQACEMSDIPVPSLYAVVGIMRDPEKLAHNLEKNSDLNLQIAELVTLDEALMVLHESFSQKQVAAIVQERPSMADFFGQ